MFLLLTTSYGVGGGFVRDFFLAGGGDFMYSQLVAHQPHSHDGVTTHFWKGDFVVFDWARLGFVLS